MKLHQVELEKILPKDGPPLSEVNKYIEKYKNDLIVVLTVVRFMMKTCSFIFSNWSLAYSNGSFYVGTTKTKSSTY